MTNLRGIMALALGLALALPSAAAAAQTQDRSRVQTPPTHRKLDDEIFGPDKIKHFFIAGFVESMTFAGAQAVGANHSSAPAAAIGVTAAVSIGRELHDRRKKGLFSIRDLAWDALGAAAALLVLSHAQK